MKYLSDDQESKRKLIPGDRVKEDNKEDSEKRFKIQLHTKCHCTYSDLWVAYI